MISTGINVTPAPFFGNPHVVAVSVMFHTTSKDKDQDTLLDVMLSQGDGTVIAARSGVAGHWVEKTSHLISLEMKTAPAKPEVEAVRLSLRIRPIGNEVWGFNVDTFVVFSDESVHMLKWTEVVLSTHVPDVVNEGEVR